MSNHHDFTSKYWGHNLGTIAPLRFVTWSRPVVKPGDTFSYETTDHRIVTYRALQEGYNNPLDPGDQAFFNAEKVK